MSTARYDKVYDIYQTAEPGDYYHADEELDGFVGISPHGARLQWVLCEGRKSFVPFLEDIALLHDVPIFGDQYREAILDEVRIVNPDCDVLPAEELTKLIEQRLPTNVGSGGNPMCNKCAALH